MSDFTFPNTNLQVNVIDSLIRSSLVKKGFAKKEDMTFLVMPLYLLLFSNCLAAIAKHTQWNPNYVFKTEVAEKPLTLMHGLFSGSHQQKFLLWAIIRDVDKQAKTGQEEIEDIKMNTRLKKKVCEKFDIDPIEFSDRVFTYGTFIGEADHGNMGNFTKKVSLFGTVFFDDDFAVKDEIGFLDLVTA